MFKKADLSLNVIIVAVILIIVLVVVVSIFSGKMNLFSKGVRSCAGQAGHCSCWSGQGGVLDKWETPAPSSKCSSHPGECPDGWGPVEGTDCNSDKVEGNDLCCIKVM